MFAAPLQRRFPVVNSAFPALKLLSAAIPRAELTGLGLPLTLKPLRPANRSWHRLMGAHFRRAHAETERDGPGGLSPVFFEDAA